MFDRLRELISGPQGGGEPNEADRAEAIRLATAALLVEMSRADFEESDGERDLIVRLLAERFGLSPDDARQLQDSAQVRVDVSVSLHEFTRLLHEHLDHEEKLGLIEMLWGVALADDRLDRYEDYLVRKLADLLYVSHADLVRLRHRVQTRRKEE